MVRMKDVLKTYDELKRSPSEATPNTLLDSADSGKLSGLDAIRQAIQSNLKQQQNEPISPPPPTPQQTTLEKIKSAITPEDKSKDSAAAEGSAVKPVVDGEEQQATRLYMDFHRMFEKIVSDIKSKTPIDPEPLIMQVPAFCTLIENNEFLFLKAIQRKRFATWVVSHSVNVGIFAVKIGLGLKFERDRLQQLALAALLHDVGMVLVPTKVLFKHGKLSPAEFDFIREHPVKGYEIVKHLKKNYPFVVDTVYQEQEREDGSGYPQGLKAAEISDFAKIVGIADIFEALVHGRAYRDGFITYHAIQKIIENRSKQFNPKFIRGLVNSVSMFPIGSLVRLSSDETARVISINKLRPVRPIVEVVEDANGRKLKAPMRINLEEEPLLYIAKPIVETG
jgi:HD-GYP domain-containing protein (c-di-GMP phosphodiesterase class II)